MGLMKIATYYRCRGDNVRFYKGDLKSFAASLLFEEYFINVDTNKSLIDSAVYSFVIKQGASSIIEFIKTGKHAPLEKIAKYSTLLASTHECLQTRNLN